MGCRIRNERLGMSERTPNEHEYLVKSVDVLESNARVQAKLLADTGRQRDALVKALESTLCELTACGKQLGAREGGSVWYAQEKARRILAAVGSPTGERT
jgi:hypothetical protein